MYPMTFPSGFMRRQSFQGVLAFLLSLWGRTRHGVPSTRTLNSIVAGGPTSSMPSSPSEMISFILGSRSACLKDFEFPCVFKFSSNFGSEWGSVTDSLSLKLV